MAFENLIPNLKYTCANWLHTLRHLLPTGPIWEVPLCVELQDCSPPWVDHATWVEDTMQTGIFNPWWNDAFKDAHELREYPPGSGLMVAVAGGNGQRRLTTGLMSGDFDLRWNVTLGENDTGNASIHFRLLDAGNTEQISFLWDNDLVTLDDLGSPVVSASVPFEAYLTIHMRLERISNVVTAYYRLDDSDPWIALSPTITESVDLYVNIDTATNHGISLFNLQAATGLQNTAQLDFSTCSPFAILLSVIAREMARLEDFIVNFRREAIPGLSTQLLSDWETLAGLPDECSPLALNVGKRQIDVHEKITVQYAQNVAFYIAYAASFGSTITIIEEPAIPTYVGNTPLKPSPDDDDYEDQDIGECGRSTLSALGVRHVWTVNIPTGDVNKDLLECRFNQIKQAHTRVVFVEV